MINDIPLIPISSIQRTNDIMQKTPVTCVLKRNVPVFYTVLPERMEILLNAEKKLNDALEIIEAVKHGQLIAEDL